MSGKTGMTEKATLALRGGSGGSKQRDCVLGRDYSAEPPGSQGARELGQKTALRSREKMCNYDAS